MVLDLGTPWKKSLNLEDRAISGTQEPVKDRTWPIVCGGQSGDNLRP